MNSTALINIVPDDKQLIPGERLKFVDGRWSDANDAPVPEKMLVLNRIATAPLAVASPMTS